MITIDRTRLDALRVVRDRERASADAATALFQELTESAMQIRREILAVQRRSIAVEGEQSEEIGILQARRDGIEERLATAAQTLEISQERSQAATLLFRRCDMFVRDLVNSQVVR